jgi:2-aminoadipate transaminase
MLSTPMMETTQGQIDPQVIDLGVGHPKTALLPIEMLYRAVQARFAAGDPYFLQYGVEQGDGYLRLSLGEFLSLEYGFSVDPEQLFITCGASMGIDLACTLFTRPGDTIFVEEPTYFLALKIFADHYLKPIAIPIDQDGLIIEALEDALFSHRPSLLYSVPTYQNPSGISLSAERRARLAELSQEYNFLILADEVYHFLNYTNRPPKPMAGYIGEGNVISLGSFSKILAPGLRVGWMLTDKERITALVNSGLLDSGGGMNPFTSALLRDVLVSGDLLKNIQNLRILYSQRLSTMDTALRQYLPGATYQKPEGGYFFWVRLPGDRGAQDLLERARTYRVRFQPGVRFSSQAGLQPYARLCFAYYEPDNLDQGIYRMAKALEL